MRKSIGAIAAVLTAFLALGAVTASAHGGPKVARVSTSSLVTAAASQLNVTRSSLVAAIQSSADATIDDALADEDITDAQADDLKSEASDNLDEAYRLSRASTVASKLGITSTALNTGFRTARKALLNAKIDAALAAGTITADETAALKQQVSESTSGYKAGGLAVLPSTDDRGRKNGHAGK
jgi:hypothetical protein